MSKFLKILAISLFVLIIASVVIARKMGSSLEDKFGEISSEINSDVPLSNAEKAQKEADQAEIIALIQKREMEERERREKEFVTDYTPEAIMAWLKARIANDFDGNWHNTYQISLSDAQIEEFSNSAARGEVSGLVSLAVIKCFGEYVDREVCVEHLKPAVETGDSAAFIIDMLYSGDVKEDEIIRIFAGKAKAGDSFAQMLMMEVEEDTPKSIPWIEMAIENGHIRAIYNLWNVTSSEQGADIITVSMVEKAFEDFVNSPPKSEALFRLRQFEIYETAEELHSDYDKNSSAEARAERVMEQLENLRFSSTE